MRDILHLRTLTALCLLAAGGFTLAACESVDDGIVADTAPPAISDYEEIPQIANPSAEIWRPGYWAMEGGSFVWVPGKILARPDPTAVWAPARWVKHSYGWTFQQGHWQ